jgi:hypothetical protein
MYAVPPKYSHRNPAAISIATEDFEQLLEGFVLQLALFTIYFKYY